MRAPATLHSENVLWPGGIVGAWRVYDDVVACGRRVRGGRAGRHFRHIIVSWPWRGNAE